MKTCYRCHKKKPLTEFYVCKQMSDVHFGKCKECYRIDVVTNRVKKLEYYRAYDHKRKNDPARREQRRRNSRRTTRLFPTKRNAHHIVWKAIRAKTLFKKPCEVCGNPNVDAHHDDYGKPLEVRWLCVRHHHAAHRKYDYDALLKKI